MCLPPPEHKGQGCDAMDLFFEIEERKIMMSEPEYINKELKEHPEPGYLRPSNTALDLPTAGTSVIGHSKTKCFNGCRKVSANV